MIKCERDLSCAIHEDILSTHHAMLMPYSLAELILVLLLRNGSFVAYLH